VREMHSNWLGGHFGRDETFGSHSFEDFLLLDGFLFKGSQLCIPLG
jgi:hypothetical protein